MGDILLRTDECAPGCDWPVTGYHAKSGGQVLCGLEVKPLADDCPEGCLLHTSCCIQNVNNPLRLLEDMAVIIETDQEIPKQPGDEEQAQVFRSARDQLLIRPSDLVCWAIIRWTLAGDDSEEDINKMASQLKEARDASATGAAT